MVDVLSVKTTLSISLRSPGLKTHFAINYGQVNSYYDLNCSSAMATPASMGHSNDLYGLKRYFVRLCHLTLCEILCQFLYLDTRLPKLGAGGQGLYLRSLDHLGRGSEVKENKIIKKVKCDQPTNRPTDKAGCRVA